MYKNPVPNPRYSSPEIEAISRINTLEGLVGLFLSVHSLQEKYDIARYVIPQYGEKGVLALRDTLCTPVRTFFTAGFYDETKNFARYLFQSADEIAQSAADAGNNDDMALASLRILHADRLLSGALKLPHFQTLDDAALKGETAAENAVMRAYLSSRRARKLVLCSPQKVQLATYIFRFYADDRKSHDIYESIRDQERQQAISVEARRPIDLQHHEKIMKLFDKLRTKCVSANVFEFMPYALEDTIATIGAAFPHNSLLANAGKLSGGSVIKNSVDELKRRFG